MASFELQQKVTTLESEFGRQNQEIENLKTENARQSGEIDNLKTENTGLSQAIVNLKTENARQSNEIEYLKTENTGLRQAINNLKTENAKQSKEIENLHTRVDELKSSMEFLVKKYHELEKRTAGTSTTKDNIADESNSDVPMEVLPSVQKPSDISSITTVEDVKDLEDQFAKLPAEKLAAEMWISAMKNLPELSGPETFTLMEKQKANFAQFITSVASKEHFCDAVKNTCRERNFSKGIVKKIYKIANDMTI